MINREYIETLSNLDFARFLFSDILPIGKEYNDSILGIADWLGRDRCFDESDNELTLIAMEQILQRLDKIEKKLDEYKSKTLTVKNTCGDYYTSTSLLNNL